MRLLDLPELRLVNVQLTERAHRAQDRQPLLAEALRTPPAPLPVLDTRARDAVFYEHPVRSILNPPESTGMGYWSANPYVGCEFGCNYCYARFTHRYVTDRSEQAGRLPSEHWARFQGDRGWHAFEHRIFVKRKESLLSALERDLARANRRRLAGEEVEIVLGTATDPYQPAERKFGLSRSLLERLGRERGLCIGIITKSPLICRDIDVLQELQRQNRLTIHVSLISSDSDLIKVLEARSPRPHARLRALSKLSAAGLNAGLIVAPVLPGINDSVASLEALLRAASDAGARFAHPAPLRLYASMRDYFLRIIDAHFPELATRYREVYQGLGLAPRHYSKALSRRFRAIAARHHLRVDEMEKGPHSAPSGRETQLRLW